MEPLSKIRIHELAKELDISSKVVIEKVKEYGLEASSHMSTLEDDTVKKLKTFYAPKKEVQKTVEKKEKPQQSSQLNRPQQSNNRPQQGSQLNRPQQSDNRPQQGSQLNRPQQSNNRPQQSSQLNRPQQGTRPQTSDNRANGGRPQGTNPSNGTRPNNNNNRNNTNRPNGQNGQNRPNFDNRNNRGSNKFEKKPMTGRPTPRPKPVKAEELGPRTRQIPESISVRDFAAVIGKNAAELIKELFKKGQMLNINHILDFETATAIAIEYEVTLELEVEKDIFEEAFKEGPEDETLLVERPPVVVVMGHVDHGKTSLLDSIRESKVTAGEAGGITQHIGAYTVEIDGNPITFLDTPGHEAFTAMRMRGAQVTDIAILVVAADDGVMPQTVEAINHAKAAGVEIIVAINKIDKVGANPDRVKQELTEYGLLTEDWGGDTICVPVSAINKTGIDTLLEMIILAAEIKELKANPKKKARGTVIEAQLDKGRGTVATILVQDGTLSIGDPIVAGSAFGKIRAMMDDRGRRVKHAGPSSPVEILGLSEVPTAGDAFYVAENEKQARFVAETVVAKTRKEMIKSTPQKVSLDDLFTQIQSGNVKDLNVVVKADVQGSMEAVKQSLEKLSNDEVRVRIIHGGVGTITESDIMLASASNAIVIGFNVREEATVKGFADEEDVDVRLYRVIYNAIEDVSKAMKGLLDPVYEEKIIGHAEVRQIFKASGIGTIAGSYITDGKFQRNCSVRIFRDDKKVHEGELESLKRFKDDVKEVNTNYECGLVIKKYSDLQEGDRVEAYIMVEVPR